MIKASKRNEAIAKASANGFTPIINGLGLLPGSYHLVTAQGEEIFDIKEVTANSNGKKWAITLVACTVTGATDENKHVSKAFGLGEADAQLAVSADAWLSMQPNTKYAIEINDKGRVGSVKLAEAGSETSSDEPKKEKKAKKDKGLKTL